MQLMSSLTYSLVHIQGTTATLDAVLPRLPDVHDDDNDNDDVHDGVAAAVS